MVTLNLSGSPLYTMNHQRTLQPSDSTGAAAASHTLSPDGFILSASSSSGGGGKSSDSSIGKKGRPRVADPVQHMEYTSKAGGGRAATGAGRARVSAGGEKASTAAAAATAEGGGGPRKTAGTAAFTYAYYVVTSDGDDYMAPNAFKIPKRSNSVTLQDVKDYFPLPGTYHFRFKVRVKEPAGASSAGETTGKHGLHQQPFVWLDVMEDAHLLPLYDHRIYIKATRLSWQQEPSKAEAARTRETASSTCRDGEYSSGTVGPARSSAGAAAAQQRRVAASPAATEQRQEHVGARAPPDAAPEPFLVAGMGGRGGAFSAAATPGSAAGSLQQQRTQQPDLAWAVEVERKPDTAAAAANMLLLDEDLPTSRDVTQPAFPAAKVAFNTKNGTSNSNLDLMF